MTELSPGAASLISEFLKENWDDFLLLADHHDTTEREAHDFAAELEQFYVK